MEDGESPADAAAREVNEESGIQVAAGPLREAAQVTFLFPVCPRWDMIAFVFTSAEWTMPPSSASRTVAVTAGGRGPQMTATQDSEEMQPLATPSATAISPTATAERIVLHRDDG